MHRDDGVLFADFGKAMFATVRFSATCDANSTVAKVELGEKLSTDDCIDANPPGTVRYRCIEVPLQQGTHRYQVVIPPDERNTNVAGIPMPSDVGEVLPMRYCQIAGGGFTVDDSSLQMIAAHVTFDDDAAQFTSSDDTLNAVWDLCKHTIKATTFCGVYVDGDRERIPYEGDAYINQLSHYAVDFANAVQIARYSTEYLMQYPTWFADWNLHSVFMAWADYLYTGQQSSIACFYQDLRAKTLIELAREDGLICTDKANRPASLEARLHLYHERYMEERGLMDLVDWPPGSFTAGGTGERDNHEMMPINTVVNALHYQACKCMARIAAALGHDGEIIEFDEQAEKVRVAMNEKLFDSSTGLYVDGEGSTHSSLHSNMFPLAFGMVPEDRKQTVLQFVESRGMACSVYGSQYLLEALYDAGSSEHALKLMTAKDDRSWYHMIEQGSTMTLEAWAHRYKNNLDWNHAWATAPLNIITRKLMGIQVITPGWQKVRFAPQPATLAHATLKLPTPHGPIFVSAQLAADGKHDYQITCPHTISLEMQDSIAEHTQIQYV